MISDNIDNLSDICGNCPICKSIRLAPFCNIYDDRYGYIGSFLIIKCLSCNHKYIVTKMDSNKLAELYTDYYPRSSYKLEDYKPHMEVKWFKAWLNGINRSAYRWVPKNARVLDVGCGYGESLGYHKARGCEVYGVEADKNVQRVADKYGFNIQIGLFKASDFKPDCFDYITLDQVIEHSNDPIGMLRGVAQLLNKNGKAVLSTPNSNGWGTRLFGKRWINWHAPYHCHLFSKKSLEIAAKEAGLFVDQMKTITPSEWLKYQWIHMIMFPRMGTPSLFWTPPANRNFDRKIKKIVFNLAVLFSVFLHFIRLNHLITRFFDSIGQGDNYLIILRLDRN